MNKITDVAKKVSAAISVAAFTVATTGYRVFAGANTAGGYDDYELEAGGGGGSVGTVGENARAGVSNVNPGANTDLMSMIRTILNVIFGIIGIIAVIMIVIGGVYYTTSQGDADKTKKGKNTIMYGIIGLVVVLLSFAIVNYVLSGLIGG